MRLTAWLTLGMTQSVGVTLVLIGLKRAIVLVF